MASSVPSVIPAFISLIQGALPANAQVALGTTFTIPAAEATTAVLVSAVRFTQDEYAELGPTYRHEEHYDIICCLYNTGGMYQDEPGLSALMVATYALYNDISVAVATNPTLGLTLGGGSSFRLGWCRQLEYDPAFDITGRSFGKLDFEVECQARMVSLS
jgi:hypothetical protein